jgi:hypothetical protein
MASEMTDPYVKMTCALRYGFLQSRPPVLEIEEEEEVL